MLDLYTVKYTIPIGTVGLRNHQMIVFADSPEKASSLASLIIHSKFNDLAFVITDVYIAHTDVFPHLVGRNLLLTQEGGYYA